MAPLLHAAALTLLISALSHVHAVQENFGSQPALTPAVHWDQDTTNIQHLLPVNNHDLYYTDDGVADPTLEHTFAQISTNLSHPAVILDHSSYVKSVQCAGQDLTITFTNSEGYDFAKKAWADEIDFILSTYTTGCGTSTQQRTFWLIDHLVYDGCDTCITAVVQKEIDVEDALAEVDLVWGKYKPTASSAPPASPKAARALLVKRQAPGNSSGGACGPAPSAKLNGLATATCGSPTFDQDLDNAIGYYEFDVGNYSESLRGFAPGLGDFSPEDNSGFGPVSSNSTSTHLQRRQRKGLFGFADRIAASLARAYDAAAAALKNLGTAVANGAQKVAQQISDAFEFSPRIGVSIPFYKIAGPKNNANTPWGGAYQLLAASKARSKVTNGANGAASGSIAAYCVGCRLTGELALGGVARWTLKDKLQSATVSIEGGFDANLAIGIVASVQAVQSFNRTLIAQGIPGFSIPGVIIVGPAIDITAEAVFDVSLQGQVRIGAGITITDFSSTLDFVNDANSKSVRLVPDLTPIFDARGQITVNGAVALPLSIGIGLQIPALKFKKSASITNKPSISASGNFTASTNCRSISGSTSCLNGIGYNVDFTNSVDADLFGLTTFNLHRFEYAVVKQKCIRLGPAPNCPAKRSSIDHHGAETAPHLKKRQLDGPDPFDYVTEPATNASSNDAIYQLLNQTVFSSLESAAANRTTNGSLVVFAPDTNFVNITDLSGNDALVADEDGNIYYAAAGNGSSLFAVVSGFVEGDDAGRFFHYYTDTMAAYNVSRLRLSNETAIPITSDFVGLAPVNYNNNSQTPDVYAAVDTLGKAFFPVTCDIQNQPSKAFLVADIAQGTQKLLDPSLRNTVTGGIVTQCYFLPWAAKPGSADLIPSALNGSASAASPSGSASSSAAPAPVPAALPSNAGVAPAAGATSPS